MIFLFIKLVKVLNFVFDKLTVAKKRANFLILTSVFSGVGTLVCCTNTFPGRKVGSSSQTTRFVLIMPWLAKPAENIDQKDLENVL